MKRRDFLCDGRHAALSAFAVNTINGHPLFAKEGSQSTLDSLEQRIARGLQAYDAQGNHRTGTEIDNASARWLADEARRAGAHVSLEPFLVQSVDIQSCFLRIGEHRLDTIPLFDCGFT